MLLMLSRTTISHIKRSRIPLHLHDFLSASPKFLFKNSSMFRRHVSWSNLRSIHEISTVLSDNHRNLTESELESYIEALEDRSTMTIHDKTIPLHKVMSLCAQLATPRGAALAERVLWLALGDDNDSSFLKRFKGRTGRTDNNTQSALRYSKFEEDINEPVITPGPSLEMYTMAIQAWTSVAAIYGKQQSRRSLGNPYHMGSKNIIETENKAGEAANRALQILDFMWEEYQRSYAEKDNFNDSNDRYQRYMQRLSKGDDSMGGRRSVAPNTVHYTSVIRAFSWNVTSKDAPYQAEHLMRQMENQSGIEEFRCLIDSAGHSNNHTSLDKYLNFDRDLIPDRTAYNSLLNAFSRNRAIPITEKVHAMRQIMKRMEEFSSVLQDQKLLPNTVSYNLLIMAYGSPSGDQDRDSNHGCEAENILKDMISVNSCLGESVHMNLADYNYTNDDDGDSSNSTLPNIKSYNGVINAWAVDSIKIGSYGPLRAELILSALLRNASSSPPTEYELGIPIVPSVLPDTATFNSVIAAWTRSRDIDAGPRAEKLLQFMLRRKPVMPSSLESTTEESFHRQDVKPSHFKNFDSQQVDHLKIEPDSITFNAVIHAWCNCGAAEAAQKAFDLLRFMITEYKSGNDHCKPSVSSFSATINKLAHCGDSNRACMAQDLLEALLNLQTRKPGENFQPSRTCFSDVLDAWSSGPMIKGAGDKAYTVLNSFKKFFQPDADEYNQILALLSHDANANDGHALNEILKCHQLLLEIINGYEDDRSKPPPNIHSFHHVLRACDCPSNDYETCKSILRIANDTLAKLAQPDSQTYILMFKIIQTNQTYQSTSSTTEFGRDLFRSCCEQGLLTNAVLKITEQILPSQYLELKRTYAYDKTSGASNNTTLSVSHLPSEWSRNRRKGQNQKRNRNRR